jgi:hypothetical protein
VQGLDQEIKHIKGFDGRCHTRFLRPKPDAHRIYVRIKLSYIRSECKHRISMSLLYRILLQKFITSSERTKQRNGTHLVIGS